MSWSEFLGGPFWIGTTAVLGAGAVAMLCARRWIDQQRLAELAVLGTLLWVALAVAPLPRIGRAAAAPRGAASAIAHAPVAAAPPIATSPRRTPTARAPAAARAPTPGPNARAPRPARPASGAPRPPAPAPIDWRRALVRLWVCGAALSVAWLLAGALALRRVLRDARPARASLARFVRGLPAAAGLRRPPRVLESSRARQPFCCGLIRPTIVLPGALCEADARPELFQILRHEVAHLAHGDLRGRAMFCLAMPVLFAHPLFWWLRHRGQLAAELLADERAARETSRRSYARALIGIADRQPDRTAAHAGAIPAFGRESVFYRRMKMLLLREHDLVTCSSKTRRATRAAGAMLCVVAAAALWGNEPLAAQDPGSRRLVRDLRETISALETKNAALERSIAVLTAKIDELSSAEGTVGRLIRDDAIAKALEIQTAQVQRAIDALEALRRANAPWLPDPVAAEIVKGPVAIDPLAGLPGPTAAPSVGPTAGQTVGPAAGASVGPAAGPAVGPTDVAQPAAAGQHAMPSFGPPDNRDVLDLADRAIDIRTGIEAAQADLQESEKLAEKDLVTKSELRQAKIRYQGFQRKYDVVRRLIDGEREASEAALKGVKLQLDALSAKAHPARMALEAQLIRLQARLDILARL